MVRTTLPVCLLLACLTPLATAGEAPVATKAADATPARVSVNPKTTAENLTKHEKVALALLGQMASGDRAKATKAERLFARIDDADKMRPLTVALTLRSTAMRIRAAQELQRIGDDRALRPLLARILREPAPKARVAMARAAGSLKVPAAVHTLARALDARDEVVRRRAAEALGYLGEVEAMPYLIAKWEGRSGDFPRVYISQVKQLSYIQDFDVEVASTAFIADPIVGVAQPGTALGVKILATEQTQSWAIGTSVLQRSLSSLAGGAKASSAKGWRRWWDDNAETLLRD